MQHQAGEAVAAVTQPDETLPVTLTVVGRPAADRRDRDELVSELFRQEYAALVRLAYVVLHDRGSAEDVVMEAFCSLHSRWATVRNKAAPAAYLRSAVLFGCRSRIRELVRERSRRPLAEVNAPDPSSAGAIAHDEAHALAVGVRSLPDRQREVVVCRYYLELSEAETAELLGISVGSVKRHAHRAREALLTLLEVRR